MDFKAQIEQARRQVDLARREHDRATQALVDAITRLGILTGGYHGISALEGVVAQAMPEDNRLDGTAHEAAEPGAVPEPKARSGTRAKKGWGKRRTDEIVRLHPDGISREAIGSFAAETGEAIHDATLRNALRDLLGEGRIRQQGNLFFALGTGDAPVEREPDGDLLDEMDGAMEG